MVNYESSLSLLSWLPSKYGTKLKVAGDIHIHTHTHSHIHITHTHTYNSVILFYIYKNVNSLLLYLNLLKMIPFKDCLQICLYLHLFCIQNLKAPYLYFSWKSGCIAHLTELFVFSNPSINKSKCTYCPRHQMFQSIGGNLQLTHNFISAVLQNPGYVHRTPDLITTPFNCSIGKYKNVTHLLPHCGITKISQPPIPYKMGEKC